MTAPRSRECLHCECRWVRARGDGLNLCPGCEVDHSWCSKCQSALPRDGFALNPTTRTGLNRYCRGCSVGWKLQIRYGIDADEYDRLLRSQGGTCAICHQAPQDSPLVVDHCHTGGQVRGLLCSPCNTAIGLLKDNPSVITRAATYVESHVAA